MLCDIRGCDAAAVAVVRFPRGGKTKLCDDCLSERGPTFEASGYRVELLPAEDPKRADR
jgi:hypothetical protein